MSKEQGIAATIGEDEAIGQLTEVFLSMDKDRWDVISNIGRPNIVRRIEHQQLEDKDYSGWDFSGISFEKCDFKKFKFIGCDLESCGFVDCTFSDCNFNKIICGQLKDSSPSAWSRCEFYKCTMHEMITRVLSLGFTTFKKCDMTGSEFLNADFNAVSFLNSDLSGCSFRWAIFQKGVLWEGSVVNSDTILDQAVFLEGRYDVTDDNASKIKFKGEDVVINWKRIHFLSTIPLFGVSWAAFVLSVIFVNAIQTLNQTKFIEVLDYPVPVPERIFLIILSSVFLAIATTIYKIKCPDLVQNFTESQWVYEHKHPRPRYLVNALAEQGWRRVCFILMILGSLIAGGLILERLYSAVSYLFSI